MHEPKPMLAKRNKSVRKRRMDLLSRPAMPCHETTDFGCTRSSLEAPALRRVCAGRFLDAFYSPFFLCLPCASLEAGSRQACTTYARITSCTEPTATSADTACWCSSATRGKLKARENASNPPRKHTSSVPSPKDHSSKEKPTSVRTGCDVAMRRPAAHTCSDDSHDGQLWTVSLATMREQDCTKAKVENITFS